MKECDLLYKNSSGNISAFSVIHLGKNIGVYEIVHINDDVCEISLEIDKEHRNSIKKSLVEKCLKFPSELGYLRVLIWTELERMVKFLEKMHSYGVKYLKKCNSRTWFEVHYGK